MMPNGASPFHVDVSRIGGSFATHRHAFSYATPRKPKFLPPPPKRLEIGSGIPSAPVIGDAELAGLRAKITGAVEALRYEVEVEKAQADLVSPDTLLGAPDLYRQIPILGANFTPEEIRGQIVSDTQAIAAQAERLAGGAAAPYVTDEQAALLGEIQSDARTLSDYVTQFGISPIPSAKANLSAEETLQATSRIARAVDDVEREIVMAEAGSIPVQEPMEKTSIVGIVAAVAVLAAVGLVIAEII